MNSTKYTLLLALSLALSLSLAACGGSSQGLPDAAGEQEVQVTEAAEEAVPDVLPEAGPDNGPEESVEALAEIAAEAATESASEAADEATGETGFTPTRPGNVYVHDPVTDGATSQQALVHLTDEAGRLTGEFADVFNCLADGQGEQYPQYGFEVCHVVQTVEPDPDGTYLSILPPAQDTDGADPFAEVQMYYHVNVVHDFFAAAFGVTHMDKPLKALVNLQLKQDGWWQPFDNAAYMPEESASMFGLNEDAIIFGQGSFVDFTYDASVIYHEYTHSVIGSERLLANRADVYGINLEPLAMNEAHADYFAASMLDSPIIGAYALNFMGMNLTRDLTQDKHCPEDMVGESHEDGKMWSTAMWAIRGALGQEVADALVFSALMQYGADTTFEEASAILIDEAAKLGSEAADAVSGILQARALTACQRVKPFVNLESVPYQQPLVVTGTYLAGLPEFNKFVPQAFQYVANVPEGTQSITLTFGAHLSDEMGGYWQGAIKPAAAFRSGSAIAYQYGASTKVVADAFLDAEKTSYQEYSITLRGSCVRPGDLYLQFINKTVVDIQLDSMLLAFSPDDPGALPVNFEGCE
jgi:hypothetical protein